MTQALAEARSITSPVTGDVIGWRITCERGHVFTTNDAHAPSWFLARHRAATHGRGCVRCGRDAPHPPRLDGPDCVTD